MRKIEITLLVEIRLNPNLRGDWDFSKFTRGALNEKCWEPLYFKVFACM